jgi:parvulin-like peptidyl-prolyl isomerase
MRVRFGFAVLVLSLLVALGCSSDEQASVEQGEEELAAQVDSWTFTRDQLQEVIETLPESDRAKYDTPGGRAELTDAVIQEELYYQEGLKLGLHDEEKIKETLEAYERSLVVAEYFNQNIKPLAHPDDQEMHDFYEENQERFTRQPIARAQHIMSKNDPDKLREFKRMVEEGEEKFTTLAHKYSDDDLTQLDGGALGFFNPGGYMRGIGYSDELSEAAFSLEVGEISEPVKWRKGWSIVVLNELRPAVVRPFDEVRDEIMEVFVVQRIDEIRKVAFDELRKDYHVDNFLAEELKLTTRTPEELWNLAQNSSDSWQRLRHYEEIVQRYPDSDHAAKAMFMIGFVNAEELKDFRAADRAFTRVLNEYPDSEVAESAKYMLETMNKAAPQLEDQQDEGGDDTEDSDG